MAKLTVFNILTFFAVFIFLLSIEIKLIRFKFKCNRKVSQTLYVAGLFRLLLTFGYFLKQYYDPKDAFLYYNVALHNHIFDLFRFISVPGTQFVKGVSMVFLQSFLIFDDKFLMLFIPYSLLAFWGSFLFFLILQKINPKHFIQNSFFAFFIPSLIYWSSNIGKDSLMFFAICSSVYQLIFFKDKRSFVFIFITLLFTFFIRPHIFAFMLLSAILGILLKRDRFRKGNVLIALFIFFIFISTSDRIFKFLNIDVGDMQDTSAQVSSIYTQSLEQIEMRSDRYASTGTTIKRTGPLNIILTPVYMVYWVCTPFLWEAKKPLQIISALESVLFQFMLFTIFLNWRVIKNSNSIKNKEMLILFILICSAIFGLGQSNIGLIVRQKCQVIPILIILFSIIHDKRNVFNFKI